MTAMPGPGTVGGTSFTCHAISDVGQARTGNEDNFYKGVTVFAVADGMGGHVAGEVASELALEPLVEADQREWSSATQAEQALAEAVRAANADVVARATADRSLRGMGTTLTAVLVREGRLHLAHVGDSRAYLYRPGEGMSQLTTDHTLVEQLVREGRLSRDEIATHPQRSVITRAIGVEDTVEVDTLPPIELKPGDQVLLCSDGLTGPVDDSEIATLLASTDDGDEAVRSLVHAANREGGPDNITVVLLRVRDAPHNGSAAMADVNTMAGLIEAGEHRDDTAEFHPVPAETEVHRIRTREDGGGGFDADSLARLGSRPEPRTAAGPTLEAASSRSHRGRRVLFGLLGLAILVSSMAAGGYYVLSRSYFIGVDEGQVAILRGLPQEVAGISLSRTVERTDLEIDDLPAFRQPRLREGIGVQSLEDGRERVAELRAQVAEESDASATPPRAASTPRPQATPRAAATAQPQETPSPPASP
ncbi:MAG: Stp1/IreP family PP2C-type Ser/Thr phosphatase [Nitriliruptorales bacterium]|nr:Stp1/IreP family PP2C-type Ser/Thr phosphatase [Nitriliruptorales bacterium]